MTRRLLYQIVSLIILTKTATAEDDNFFFGDEPLLATASQVKVRVVDQVREGCFTNVDAVQTAVELIFRRNEIDVVAQDEFSDVFEVNVLGFRSRSVGGNDLGCVAHVSTELIQHRLVAVPYANGKQTFISIRFSVSGIVLAGGDRLNDRVKENAVEGAEQLVNEIYKAREKFFPQHPDIKARFETPE